MKNKKLLFILSIFLVLIFIFGGFYFLTFKKEKNKEGEIGKIEGEFIAYYNSKGQKWYLPKEKKRQDFYVVSENKYPKFVKGYIDPLKVVIGDIQKMEVKIQSIEPLKRVWAEIEHDNGKDIVELKLVKEEEIDKNEKPPIILDEENKVILNDGGNKKEFDFALEKFFKKAIAEGIREYTYYGEWKVHSTQTKTYYTSFFVEDIKGKKDSLKMAWSDPCEKAINNSGYFIIDCTLTNAVDGRDNGNIEGFSGAFNINIFTGSIFAFNPGKYIKINNNGKFIISGGQIKQGYLYYQDNDGDGYGANISVTGKIYIPNNAGDEYGRFYQNSWFIRAYQKDNLFNLTTSSYPNTSSILSYLNYPKFVSNKNKFFNSLFFNKVEAYVMCNPDEGGIVGINENEIYYCKTIYPLPPSNNNAVNWNNINNLFADDNNFAYITLNTSQTSSKFLKVNNFNFNNIKDYALIKNIEIKVKALKTNSSASINLIALLYVKDSNGEHYSLPKKIALNSTNFQEYTISSSSENYYPPYLTNGWSYRVFTNQVKNNDFAVLLKAELNNNVTSDIRIDYIKVKIDYFIPPMLGLNDCDDSDLRTYPGQTAFLPENKDFNCSGGIEFEFDNVALDCAEIGRLNIFQKIISRLLGNKVISYVMPETCPGTVGWVDQPPDSSLCGDILNFSYGCSDSCSSGKGTNYIAPRTVYCH